MVKDLNKNPNTLKLMGEKLGNSIELIDTRKDFLNRILLAMASRSSANEWDLIEMKNPPCDKGQPPLNNAPDRLEHGKKVFFFFFFKLNI